MSWAPLRRICSRFEAFQPDLVGPQYLVMLGCSGRDGGVHAQCVDAESRDFADGSACSP